MEEFKRVMGRPCWLIGFVQKRDDCMIDKRKSINTVPVAVIQDNPTIEDINFDDLCFEGSSYIPGAVSNENGPFANGSPEKQGKEPGDIWSSTVTNNLTGWWKYLFLLVVSLHQRLCLYVPMRAYILWMENVHSCMLVFDPKSFDFVNMKIWFSFLYYEFIFGSFTIMMLYLVF